MKSLLPKTVQRRKTRLVILHAELVRAPRTTTWRLAIRIGGKRTMVFDTFTSLESAAREYAHLTLRKLMCAPRSQKPEARSQKP